MKVSQQPSALPSTSSPAGASVAEVARPEVAAAIAPPQAPVQRPARTDLFGDTARAVAPEARAETVVSSDPISGAGNRAAEKFFKGMGPTVHVVEKGDTLSQIVRDHYPAAYADLPWVPENIASANGIENPNLIHVGQELRLPGLFTYTVQGGDTLGKIAAFSGNELSEIVALNGIENPDLIRVGQEIVLEGPNGKAYFAVAERLTDNLENVTHTVKPGDTLTKLARAYFPDLAGNEDLILDLVNEFAWANGLLENPDLIRVGQELIVPGHFTYVVQEGDTAWSLNLPLNGGFSNDLRDVNGKLLEGEPVPGTTLQVRMHHY